MMRWFLICLVFSALMAGAAYAIGVILERMED